MSNAKGATLKPHSCCVCPTPIKGSQLGTWVGGWVGGCQTPPPGGGGGWDICWSVGMPKFWVGGSLN